MAEGLSYIGYSLHNVSIRKVEIGKAVGIVSVV